MSPKMTATGLAWLGLASQGQRSRMLWLLTVFATARSRHITTNDLADGAYRCCVGQTLWVVGDDWVGGKGINLERDAAGNYKGVLASMLRTMTERMGMGLEYVTQDDCYNELSVQTGFAKTNYSFHCHQRGTDAVVDLARFVTFWETYAIFDEGFGVYRTSSFIEPKTAALLRVSYGESTYGFFRFLEPFEPTLWLAVMGTAAAIGLVGIPSVLRDRETKQPLVPGGLLATPLDRVGTLYHAYSELLGGGDLEWTPNLSSRVLRVGWLFFVLLTVSTYTAELASFFVSDGRAVHGPQSMTELRAATACIPEIWSSEVQVAEKLVEWGVGSTMGGAIAAVMPSQLSGATAEERAALYGQSTAALIARY